MHLLHLIKGKPQQLEQDNPMIFNKGSNKFQKKPDQSDEANKPRGKIHNATVSSTLV